MPRTRAAAAGSDDAPPILIGGANLRDEIADYLRAEIFGGRLRPGTKIDQALIASTMGVSSIPVREALIVLERECLVHWEPRRGAFIALLTESDLRDHFALLGLVSGLVARRYAENLGFEQLEELFRMLTGASTRIDAAATTRRVRNVVQPAGLSHRLAREFEHLTESIPLWPVADPGPTSLRRWSADYTKVIAQRDADGLAELCERWMRDLGERVIADLRHKGFWDDIPA